jgi:hypothetical protein
MKNVQVLDREGLYLARGWGQSCILCLSPAWVALQVASRRRVGPVCRCSSQLLSAGLPV